MVCWKSQIKKVINKEWCVGKVKDKECFVGKVMDYECVGKVMD